MSAPRLANLGAEEGEGGSPLAGAVKVAAAAWESLFEPPAFDWLPRDDAFVAWWNDDAAARSARESGLPLFGAAPEVVRGVHDKAFALDVARRERLIPPAIVDALVPLDAELLGDVPAATAAIEQALGAWPAPWRAAFTLKPRFGTSGRGRVAGRDGRVDEAMQAAFARLARAGGAILEPWFERTADFGTALHVGPDGVLLLGTLTHLVTPSGTGLGHRVTVDSRGRVTSGSPFDESLREAALGVALAASEAGYRGPCGVDAFALRGLDGEEVLRPVVELNARFTMGIVAIGWLRRSLARAKSELGLRPGDLHHVVVAWDAPEGGWPAAEPGRTLVEHLSVDGAEARPGLLWSRDAEPVETAVAALNRRR